MNMNFLNIKSCYSFFSSSIKIDDLIAFAKKNQINALGLTDINSMFAVFDFYTKCLENNIKPIIGMEILVYENDSKPYPLVLLCKNEMGYHTLCALTKVVSGSNIVAIEKEKLNQYTKGIYAIMPAKRGIISESIKDQNFEQIIQICQEYCSIFSSFFIGKECYGEKEIFDYQFFPKQLQILVIALPSIHYLYTSNQEDLKVLQAIKKGIAISEIVNFSKVDFSLETQIKQENFYEKDEVQNTFDLTNSCSLKLSVKGLNLIEYPKNSSVSSEDYLRALSLKGLVKRLKTDQVPLSYKTRLQYELSLIEKMGYCDYFLIVYDYVKFAKNKGILVGPGRGSAAGSLVSYVLGITNVDPIEYHLLFERFLNPERISLPDIDIDFPDNRRDEVVEYLRNKYSNDHVANVIAFQTFGIRQAIRDSAKVLGMSLKDVDFLAKKIPPTTTNSTISSILKENPTFLDFINSRAIYKKMIEQAQMLEGLPRQTTLHAAGIIISRTPLVEALPIYSPNSQSYATQYDMNYLEKIGLLKMDLLGLKNLTILDDCLKRIQEQKKELFSINDINIHDPRIYEIISSGHTSGIFQLESQGMIKAILKVHPNNFEEVAALLALFRPGPMDHIDEFSDRKNGKIKVSYLHPLLEEILKTTYGIIIYQEQVIEILKVMGGFSLGSADIARRAISKKDEKALLQIKSQFIEGAVLNNIEESIAQEIFQWIEKFANYGFPRAHSVAYSVISCQMAYLKAYYPTFFYSSVLNTFAGLSAASDNKMTHHINELKYLSIQLLPVNINKSQKIFISENQTSIRYSLSNIKGLNQQMVNHMISERNNGEFFDFIEFCIRMYPYKITRSQLEILIQVGAFDDFNVNRETLLNTLPNILHYLSVVGSQVIGQLAINETLVERPAYQVVAINKNQQLQNEYEYLGMFLSGFPLQSQRIQLKKQGIVSTTELTTEIGKYLKTVLFINHLKYYRTKSGENMARLDGIDEHGSISIVVFPNVLKNNELLIKTGNYLYIEGYVDQRPNSVLNARVIKEYGGIING